ncbi:MAG: hypothetical protein LV479_08890 [Methylacidiphilales bacterium]|nr:hypothetical protein [Candidatus Methylacidiphilales bacterium]
MPWHRNDHDPVEALRRQLAEKERLISQQMSRLNEELHQSGEAPPVEIKPPEPPVWRLEEEGHSTVRPVDPTPSRKRHLARQTQRDMIVFFICVGVFIVVLLLFLWVAYVRNTALNNGA